MACFAILHRKRTKSETSVIITGWAANAHRRFVSAMLERSAANAGAGCPLKPPLLEWVFRRGEECCRKSNEGNAGCGGRYRIRTCDFHRVKMALYR